MAGTGGGAIRRIVLVAGIVSLAFAVTPRTSSAAFSLALARRDYPHGSQIAELPATNKEADVRLGPAHRSTFERLHRLDGEGWLQAAVWQFTTGRGGARRQHRTVYLYGINVFRNRAAAGRALADVKLQTRATRVAHLPALIYHVSDVRRTLVFIFFAYREVEVETYLEYTGVAPATMAKELRHHLSTQSSHLAHAARRLSALLHQKPPATATPSSTPAATDTPTAAATATASPSPSATAPPTATSVPTAMATAAPTDTATPVPTATATSVPASLDVEAQPGSAAYSPGGPALITVQVRLGGKPVVGALVNVSFNFPGVPVPCGAATDTSGNASCSVTVPPLPDGLIVPVSVTVSAPAGQTATAETSFIVHG
jgi:hypothetical protein